MATTPRLKITYATLSADNEELQSSFDAALARARAGLGETYPMIIGGEQRGAAETFDDRSPIDTDLVVARFPVGTRRDVRDAIDAARAAYPEWRDTPWRDRLDDPAPRGRPDQRAPVRLRGAHVARGWQEPARGARRRRGDGGPAALLRRRIREGGRLREAARLALAHRAHALRPAPVRRVRRDQPVQLPDGPRRRTGRRGADRRQHGRPEAEQRRAPAGLEIRRGAPRRRAAGRCLQPGNRAGRDGRRRAPGESRHRWHGLHRLLRSRDEAVSQLHERITRDRSSPRWAARIRRSLPATPTSTRPPRE